MTQKSLSNWLKGIILGIGICGLVIYAGVIPLWGQTIAVTYPEFSYCYYPWLGFIWISGIPCYGVLILGWQVASRIGNDQSFSRENSVSLKKISMLSAGDAVFVFGVNILYLLLNMNHPGIVIGFLFVVFAGAAVSVVSAALSHLVGKAAELQEQSEWTI